MTVVVAVFLSSGRTRSMPLCGHWIRRLARRRASARSLHAKTSGAGRVGHAVVVGDNVVEFVADEERGGNVDRVERAKDGWVELYSGLEEWQINFDEIDRREYRACIRPNLVGTASYRS
jgi:hypothetical protein